MTAVPRCSAPRAAVADIRRERSTESSDASRGLRRGVHDLPSRKLHGRPGVLFRIQLTSRHEGHQASSRLAFLYRYLYPRDDHLLLCTPE